MPPAQFAEQFLKDLQNADNLDQIKWIFDAQKLLKDGVTNPDNFVKLKMVDLIKNNADEFWKDSQDYFSRYGINSKQDLIDKLNVNHPSVSNFIAK